MRFIYQSILFVSVALSAGVGFAEDEGAYFDPAYSDLVNPIVDDRWDSPFGSPSLEKSTVTRGGFETLIEWMTPVRSQGKRGTCSIFSATAMLESMLLLKNHLDVDPDDLDLSEEWLEYLVMQGRTKEGSHSTKNFGALRRYGFVLESTWPYVGEKWENTLSGLPRTRCGDLSGRTLESCLLGHRNPRLLAATDELLMDSAHELFDPEFLEIRNEAQKNRDRFLKDYMSRRGGFFVWRTSQVKELLRQGIPLTAGMDVYYGSWGHRKAETYGIGRDLEQWYSGIVGFPEADSLDEQISPTHSAGHSILIIGYDDEREFTTKMTMKDGTTQTFHYKGVYYFKNSWGTEGFGREFEIDGKRYPGYGMISQDYIHEFGAFYQFPLQARKSPLED